MGLLRYDFFFVSNIKKEERWQNKKGRWEETPIFSSSHDALTLNNMSTKSSSIFRLNWVEKVSFDNLSHRKRSIIKFIVEALKMARLQPVKNLAFFSLFCRIVTLICVVSSCFCNGVAGTETFLALRLSLRLLICVSKCGLLHSWANSSASWENHRYTFSYNWWPNCESD